MAPWQIWLDTVSKSRTPLVPTVIANLKIDTQHKNMAKIIITRTNEWINKARQIGVYLDNQKIGTVSSMRPKSLTFLLDNTKLELKLTGV